MQEQEPTIFVYRHGKVLISDARDVISPALWGAFGIVNAFFMQRVQYITRSNEILDNKKWFKEDYYWYPISFTDIQRQIMPHIAITVIKRHIKVIEDLGILEHGVFNRTGSDRTKWYRIDHETLTLAVKFYENNGTLEGFKNPKTVKMPLQIGAKVVKKWGKKQ